jgi:dTDP-4-amino-4,6-dideoxygalactose transaminase
MSNHDAVPVFVPAIGIDTLKAVTDALNVGWLGMGAYTKEFEEKIATYLGGGRQVLATNTGTSALHLALQLASVGAGDEVITTSFNFVADHQAISATGARVVFCDIREDDLGLDPAKLVELIGPKTKAVLPLHYAGAPCRIDEILEIARRAGLRVIEDATHAFGSHAGGRKIGSFGDITCFSFDPVKIITSIDGGAVVVGRAEDIPTLQQLRFLGIDKDTAERYKNQRAGEYDVVRQGFRYHLTNVNASIGLSQLALVDEFIASRQRACRLYNELLGGIAGVQTPRGDFSGVSPFIYYLRVPADRRLALIEHLKSRGIASGIHFLPAHRFSFYRGARASDLSVTERVSSEIMTLPLHSRMTTELVQRIARDIKAFFSA